MPTEPATDELIEEVVRYLAATPGILRDVPGEKVFAILARLEQAELRAGELWDAINEMKMAAVMAPLQPQS